MRRPKDRFPVFVYVDNNPAAFGSVVERFVELADVRFAVRKGGDLLPVKRNGGW